MSIKKYYKVSLIIPLFSLLLCFSCVFSHYPNLHFFCFPFWRILSHLFLFSVFFHYPDIPLLLAQRWKQVGLIIVQVFSKERIIRPMFTVVTFSLSSCFSARVASLSFPCFSSPRLHFLMHSRSERDSK